MTSFKSFSIRYIENLNNLLQLIDLDEVEKFFDLIDKTQGNIYIIGNGGSSSTASHMANDLAIGLKRKIKKTINAISLCDNSAVCFAIANDTGYENIFYSQLENIVKPEDLIVAISCSGNSPNIVKAIKYCKEIGTTIVGLSGFDGGVLKEIADIKIHVQTEKNEYGLVEDVHSIINHIVYSYYLRNNCEK